MNRDTMIGRINELRAQARNLRAMAAYADSRQAREDDLDRAGRLDAEADKLERQVKETLA